MNKKKLIVIITIISIISIICVVIYEGVVKNFIYPVEDGKRESMTFNEMDLSLLSEFTSHLLVDYIYYKDGQKKMEIAYTKTGRFFTILAQNKEKISDINKPNTFEVYIHFVKRPLFNFVAEPDPVHNGKDATIYIDNSLFEEVDRLGYERTWEDDFNY